MKLAAVGRGKRQPARALDTKQNSQSNGMMVDLVSTELVALENRIRELERCLERKMKEVPGEVEEVKQEMEHLRERLESTKHLSWLNCYKELPPSSRRLEYRRRSDARQTAVRFHFLGICEEAMTEEVRQALRLPAFDCMTSSDEEILYLLQSMFLDLDLLGWYGIDPDVLRSFLFQVYKSYNDVPFHNFRHCFCVAQMMYAMTWKADLLRKMGRTEILVLLVSCICHDLDHPGYNNIYQINARTELALRYNDISPLENHHCSIAFRILELEECNIFSSLSKDDYKAVREGIIRCILATDMARHNEILAQFKEAMVQGFSFANKTHINLLSMVLIKVADISNEARPMEVAEPWLDRLLQEFFAQSDAEKQEGLPVTPFMDREKITKPSSQCSFIGFVLLPLFEALGELLTELQPMMVEPVRQALNHYRRLNEKNTASEGAPPSPIKHLSKSTSSFSLRKTSISFSQCTEDPEETTDETSSEGEETVTEVAVSEKTLKFKISTESTSSGRKSYPGSRKGSRERNSHEEVSSGGGGDAERPPQTNDKSQPSDDWRKEEVSAGSPDLARENEALQTTDKSPGSKLSKMLKRSKKKERNTPGTAPDSPASRKWEEEKRPSTLPREDTRKGWRSLLRRTKPNGLAHDAIVGKMEEESGTNNKKSEGSVARNSQKQRWMQNLVTSLRGRKSAPSTPSNT